MAADPFAGEQCWACPTDGHNVKFAELIGTERTAIMASFARRFDDLYGFVADDPGFREQTMATVHDIIADVVRSVEAGHVQIAEDYRDNAWAIVRTGRDGCLSPADGMSVAVMFFNVAVTSLTQLLGNDSERLPSFLLAIQSLNESISRRMQAVAGACTVSLLERVHQAQAQERRRIARELHDRVGEVLSVGLRRLDLQELSGVPAAEIDQATVAREVLVETMRRLRVVTSDLREEPVTSLEKALIGYLDSVQSNTDVRVRITGDEAWAPPVVLDEVFLIIREALRNALTHAAPQLVLVGAELNRHELRASVIDDGEGFVPASVASVSSTGGLTSMRERAAQIGGWLTVLSMPGHGTRVELRVSLEGHEDERLG